MRAATRRSRTGGAATGRSRSSGPATDKILGRRAVHEALSAGRRKLHEVIVARGLKGTTFREIVEEAERFGVPVKEVDRRRIDALAGTEDHQGVMALADAVRVESLSEILARAKLQKEDSFLVLLDGITDPQNFGAIMRTAEAAGVQGMVVSSHDSAPLDRATTKASSGAVEHLSVARVENLGQCVMRLQEEGVTVLSTDMDPQTPSLFDADLSGPLAVAFGSEGKGLSASVLRRASRRVRIPLFGKIESLNVSAAAAIVLFEIRRRRLAGAPARTGLLPASPVDEGSSESSGE